MLNRGGILHMKLFIYLFSSLNLIGFNIEGLLLAQSEEGREK